MLFDRKTKIAVKTLVAQEASIIYTKLEQGISPISLVGAHDSTFIEEVFQEAKRIEREIYKGIIAKPEIKANELANGITSDLLDVKTVGLDVIKWSTSDPENPPTFLEFKDIVLNNK